MSEEDYCRDCIFGVETSFKFEYICNRLPKPQIKDDNDWCGEFKRGAYKDNKSSGQQWIEDRNKYISSPAYKKAHCKLHKKKDLKD